MPQTKAVGSAGAVAVALATLVIGCALGFLWGRGTSGPDISAAGQVSYACALAEKVREGHQTEADWGPVGEDRAWNELHAIPGLLGVAAPQGDGENPFEDVGWLAPRGIGEGDWEEVHASLDATIERCGDRGT
ncbi:hypothetical protein [Ornithinicoccus halotolerans]|uniref:hypothetical protein n=1 Tax=Ornithinicoccus halotolerans TaxID=1748220 RepID=UPI0012969E68|nr:hypothetical protein [Ornithinicoccus halotolerans]